MAETNGSADVDGIQVQQNQKAATFKVRVDTRAGGWLHKWLHILLWRLWL
jgi:hypothetical protein